MFLAAAKQCSVSRAIRIRHFRTDNLLAFPTVLATHFHNNGPSGRTTASTSSRLFHSPTWRRFSTETDVTGESEKDTAASPPGITGENRPGRETLIQVAKDFCDEEKYPEGSFEESETLRTEALQVLRQLTGVGSKKSVSLSIALAERLRSDCTEDPINTDLLNLIFQNWASCSQVGVTLTSLDLDSMEALIITSTAPYSDLCATIFEKIAISNPLSFETRNNQIRQCWARYQKKCTDEEQQLQKLMEHAENCLIRLNARNQRLMDAIDMAKDSVGRIPMHEETFLSILVAAISCPSEERLQVQQFLEEMGKQYEQRVLSIRVENIFLFGWAAQIKTDGDELPDWLLQSIGWIGRQVHPEIEATAEDFERAIRVWARAGDSVRARELLRYGYEKWQSGNHTLLPTRDSYNLVLNCLAESGLSEKGAIAVHLLDQMTNQDHPDMRPNYSTYYLVLQCLETSKEENAATEAIRIVREMTEVSKAEERSQRAPTSSLYVSVSKALRWQLNDWRVMDNFVTWLEEEWKNGNREACLDISHYDQLLMLLAKSDEKDVAEKAISIFEKVERLGLIGPSASQFLHLLCNTCLSESESPEVVKVIEKAKALHEEFCEDKPFQLSAKQYQRVLRQLAISGEAEKAEEFVTMKYKKYLRDQGPQPTVTDFNCVLEAWSNSSAPRAAERADAIVQHMHVLHGGVLKDSKPNIRSYEKLLRCWKTSRLPEAKQRAEGIREKIKKFAGANGV